MEFGWCRYCKKEKPTSEFWKSKTLKSGLDPRCKDCARKNDHKRRRAFSLHKQCLEKLGDKCVKCGFADKRALQIDHVNGGGKKEILSFNGQWRKYYRHVLEDTTGKYQCLCANCNWIKKTECKEGVR